ncbi:hypothetical protein ACH40F_29125 [Streptomyces sp. NPDC020794]|uniref:hypothetical protein n=1 Tax=unclassified Streptomyces TaxID=2593676 RepID=UPI0036E1FBEF
MDISGGRRLPAVTQLGGWPIPSSFILRVHPKDMSGATIFVQYEVASEALAVPAIVTEGMDATSAVDVLRRALSMDDWAHWAVSFLRVRLLAQQLAQQGDAHAFARMAGLPVDEAERILGNVQAAGQSMMTGSKEATEALANAPEWLEAFETTRARYDQDHSSLVLDTIPVRGTPRRNSVTKQHLQEVADVYRRAQKAPTKAVAAHFKASHSTAARWVGMARAEGYLGATKRGQAGEADGTVAEPQTND